MINLSSFLKTANTCINKLFSNSEAEGTANANGHINDQAKILAQKSTETAMKDYAPSSEGVNDAFLAKYSDKIEGLADQLMDEITDHLVNLLNQEIDGEVEL